MDLGPLQKSSTRGPRALPCHSAWEVDPKAVQLIACGFRTSCGWESPADRHIVVQRWPPDQLHGELDFHSFSTPLPPDTITICLEPWTNPSRSLKSLAIVKGVCSSEIARIDPRPAVCALRTWFGPLRVQDASDISMTIVEPSRR